MKITSREKPYAVVVQQTPKQYRAEGNKGFPNKFVFGWFDTYRDANRYYHYLLDNSYRLVHEYREGILSIYSYSPTNPDSSFTSCEFYKDGTIEDSSINTATSYGTF